MENEIKIGDVVTAKDNAPMTVDKIENGIAFCVWHDEGEPQEKEFALAELIKVAP